jgi:hypothetical protein
MISMQHQTGDASYIITETALVIVIVIVISIAWQCSLLISTSIPIRHEDSSKLHGAGCEETYGDAPDPQTKRDQKRCRPAAIYSLSALCPCMSYQQCT